MARNDYSRRSNKNVFWNDDNKGNGKSDELDELFRQSEALEQQPEQAPTTNEPAYEPSYEYELMSVPEPTPVPEQMPEPEPTHEPEPTPVPEPTHEPKSKTQKNTDVFNPFFDFDSIMVDDKTPLSEEELAQNVMEFEEKEKKDPRAYTPPQKSKPQKSQPQKNVPPPYIPLQNPSTNQQPTKKTEDALDGFDVEKFIKDNDTNFTITIFCKVVSQIIFVCLVLKCLSVFPWWIVIIGGLIAKLIIEFIFSSRYSSYINMAIKSIKKVKNFNSSPTFTTPWGNLLEFFTYSNITTESEDELIIHTDETKVISHEVFFANKEGKIANKLLTCEYYIADMEGRTTFANNIIIAKSSMLYVKKLNYRKTISQYTLFYNKPKDLEKCNLPRILAIADRVSAYVGDKNFAILFSPKSINMALQTPNIDKFDYDTFNYKIADRIRRDVTAIANRVCIADILAEI